MVSPVADAIVRVACVPAAHPYVDGLGLREAGARPLADPPVAGAPLGRWWPPVMLDPRWIEAHADHFDVMHIHFGMESLSPARLAEVIAALRVAGRPLIHTVHDLSHPQLLDQRPHGALLDVVVPGADALITLTDGAADEIERRWGRRPCVLAHPAMRAPDAAMLEALEQEAGEAGGPVIGVHLRDLRPGIDGPGTVETLADALARLPEDVVGRVWLADRVRDEAQRDAVRRRCAAAGRLTLIEEPRVTDSVLERELDGLAVSLLPYRHGTHSGWLELCWDLGIPVAGPALGHFDRQHPDPGFYRSFHPGDPGSLAAALGALLASPQGRAGGPARVAAVAERRVQRGAERRTLGREHVALYRSLVTGGAGGR